MIRGQSNLSPGGFRRHSMAFDGRRTIIPGTALCMLLAALLSLPINSQASANLLEKLKGEQIAAIVFPQDKASEGVKRYAQSRLESILLDNGITVLDRKKADELKDVFKGLDDPTAFVTAETFVENAEKFKIKALVAIYLKGEVVPGLADYFTATAHADIRVIDSEDAKVAAMATPPMGIRGSPPSQGMTGSSALVNATYRAVDRACQAMSFEVSDLTEPRMVRVTLEGPIEDAPVKGDKRKPANDKSLAKIAELEDARWRAEEATCTAASPGNELGAVAGYIRDTDTRRRPPRLYGSRVHLVDIKEKKELDVFECSPVETKSRREPGTKEVLDCMFLGGWRYLAAVNGNYVFLWDTETGRELAKLPHGEKAKDAGMSFVRSGDSAYLAVQIKRDTLAYRIVRDK